MASVQYVYILQWTPFPGEWEHIPLWQLQTAEWDLKLCKRYYQEHAIKTGCGYLYPVEMAERIIEYWSEKWQFAKYYLHRTNVQLWQQPTKATGIKRPVLAQNLRIEEIIEPQGKPNSRGAAQAFCPFHNDTHPSAWVNVIEQRFGCNACWPGKWWDVVNVYAMLEGIGNGEAWGRLAHGRGSKPKRKKVRVENG